MAWGHSVVLVVLALWPGVVSPASPTLNVTALGATLSVTDREWLAAAAAKVRGYDVLNRRCHQCRHRWRTALTHRRMPPFSTPTSQVIRGGAFNAPFDGQSNATFYSPDDSTDPRHHYGGVYVRWASAMHTPPTMHSTALHALHCTACHGRTTFFCSDHWVAACVAMQ
jgi:hypothetical protein